MAPWTVCHHVLDVTKLRDRLGWQPVVTPDIGLAATARHLAASPLDAGGEEDVLIGDPFDDELENRHLAEAPLLRSRIGELPRSTFRYRHPYRHPAGVKAAA